MTQMPLRNIYCFSWQSHFYLTAHHCLLSAYILSLHSITTSFLNVVDLDLDITAAISAHCHRSFYSSILCKFPLNFELLICISGVLVLAFAFLKFFRTCACACACLRTRRSVCVCVCVHARVANTTCEACNWVCPPTTWQYRQWNRRLHCLMHNGYIRPSHPFIYWAAESHHGLAAVECVVCPTATTSEVTLMSTKTAANWNAAVFAVALSWSLYEEGEVRLENNNKGFNCFSEAILHF